MPALADYPLLSDELELLSSLVPLAQAQLIELGCGAAGLGRKLLQRHPGAQLTGLEVDARQQAKNLAAPQERLTFVSAGAQAIPCANASFDGALMLKSLHHVPLDVMDQALAEVARVLKPGGWLYVSEPVYDGALNDVVKLYNDEGVVRAAAQAAVDRALQTPLWAGQTEHWFAQPVRYADFADFEARMMRPTFVDLQIDADITAAVHAAYAPHQGPDGAAFTRPMHIRLLRRAG